LTDHQNVDHVKAGGDQLLERDRHSERQHGTKEFTIAEERERHGIQGQLVGDKILYQKNPAGF